MLELSYGVTDGYFSPFKYSLPPFCPRNSFVRINKKVPTPFEIIAECRINFLCSIVFSVTHKHFQLSLVKYRKSGSLHSNHGGAMFLFFIEIFELINKI